MPLKDYEASQKRVTELNNTELQTAIDSLLKHYVGRKGWCIGGAPDGAISDVLAKMLYEQARRLQQ